MNTAAVVITHAHTHTNTERNLRSVYISEGVKARRANDNDDVIIIGAADDDHDDVCVCVCVIGGDEEGKFSVCVYTAFECVCVRVLFAFFFPAFVYASEKTL